jgi:hypothetical protein
MLYPSWARVSPKLRKRRQTKLEIQMRKNILSAAPVAKGFARTLIALAGVFFLGTASAQDVLRLNQLFEIKGLYPGMPAGEFKRAAGRNLVCYDLAEEVKRQTEGVSKLREALKRHDAGDSSALMGSTPESIKSFRDSVATARESIAAAEEDLENGIAEGCSLGEGEFTLAKRPVVLRANLDKERVLALTILARIEHWSAIADALVARFPENRNWRASSATTKDGQRRLILDKDDNIISVSAFDGLVLLLATDAKHLGIMSQSIASKDRKKKDI